MPKSPKEIREEVKRVMQKVNKSESAEDILLREKPEVALMTLDTSIRVCLAGKNKQGRKEEVERLKGIEPFMSVWHKLGKTEEDLERYI